MSINKIERISQLIEDARDFQFCGPSDDPDEQTAVSVGYRNLVIQLKRLAAPLLPEPERQRLNDLDVEVNDMYSVYETSAELETLLMDIEDTLVYTDKSTLSIGASKQIIKPTLIDSLAQIPSSEFDMKSLVCLCKEINSCFAHGSIIATALTMRAVLNYIPPVFGHQTFEQVAANCGKSTKESFAHLQDGLRKIADFHAHRKITKTDTYPSEFQVEPYKPQFELLLQQLLEELVDISRKN